MSRALSVRRIQTHEEWLALQDAWDRLNTASAHPSVFRSFAWGHHWWQIFLGAEMERLRLFVVENAHGELVGVFPLHQQEERLGCRAWRMTGEARDHHTITEEPTILISDNHCLSVLEHLLRYLQNECRNDWDYYRFDLPLLEANFPTQAKAGHRYPSAPFLYQQSESLRGSAIVDLPLTWEAFQTGLSRSMRDNLPYYPRRLTKAGHQGKVRLLATPPEVRAALPLLFQMHAARAGEGSGTRPHTNHLPTPDHCHFLTNLMLDLAERREAFIAIFEVDDSPVAAQAFFTIGDTLTFYYSGFHTLWSPYSPLFIVATEVLQHALMCSVRRVNFLPNDEPWKKRWGAIPRGSRSRLRATRLSPMSLTYHAVAYLRGEK